MYSESMLCWVLLIYHPACFRFLSHMNTVSVWWSFTVIWSCPKYIVLAFCNHPFQLDFQFKTYAWGMNNWWRVHPYKCLSSFKHHYFLPCQNTMPQLCPDFLCIYFCQQYLQVIRRMSDNVYVGTNLICTLWAIYCPFVWQKMSIGDWLFSIKVFLNYLLYNYYNYCVPLRW